MDCHILEVNICLSRASGRAKMNLWKAVIEYSYLNKDEWWTVIFSRSIFAFPELQEELKWTSEKQSLSIHILTERRMMDCHILEVNICLSRASGRAKMNLWKAVIEYSYINKDEWWTVIFLRSIFAFPELQEELKWTSEKQSLSIHILNKDEWWTVIFSRSIIAFPELQEELKWTSEKQSLSIHINNNIKLDLIWRTVLNDV